MLDAMSIKMARKLAGLVCEARNLADELSNDIQMDSQEPKNQRIAEELDDLSYEVYQMCESLGEIEHDLDALIAPYDKEIA